MQTKNASLSPICPEPIQKQKRGRRRGNAATCRMRLKGWIENVATRSPIWGDVDLKAFCRVTGYSREHATRELSKLRRSGEFAFETKQRKKQKLSRKTWGVIVAHPTKLRYDKRSLFFDQRGKPLHNYTKLGKGGEKIEPTEPGSWLTTNSTIPESIPVYQTTVSHLTKQSLTANAEILPKSEMAISANIETFFSGLKAAAAKRQTQVCDNANIEKDSYGIQQTELYGAARDIVLRSSEIRTDQREPNYSALRRKAFVMLPKLEACHWDNCKVRFCRRTAFCYALNALKEGHQAERIVCCYEEALFVCHGHAVDRAASIGEIVFFNLSSTVSKARKQLRSDGLTRRERVAQWYRQREEETSQQLPAGIDPVELAWFHAQILATFPED